MSPNRADKQRILVVEDNQLNLDMLLDILKIRDYSLAVARNGKEAMALAKSEKPDLILMDVNMPEMGGKEAARKLRDLEGFRDLPIVALSADADPESVQRCLDAGYTHHIAKPFRVGELFKIIDQYIKPRK